MLDYLIAGGPVMIPIAFASVVGLAAFLERLWSLRRPAVIPGAFLGELVELMKKGKYDEAISRCKRRDVAVSRLVLTALDVRGKPRAVIKERLEEVGRREAAELERFIPVLATIGALGPLLGLLGTVGGMIVTFEAVKEAGASQDVSDLAGGIAQALITTFAGLCIAIPAVVAHRYLLSRVDGLVIDLEEVALMLLELVSDESTEAPAVAAGEAS